MPTALYVTFVLFLFIERISNTFTSKRRERGKTFYNWLTYTLFASYLIIIGLIIAEHFISLADINAAALIGGIFFLILGIFLRRTSKKTLGKFWSFYIEIIQDHRIIADGPYKYLRHPYGIGVICELLGFALLSGSFYSIVVIATVQVPLVAMRAIYEEKVMSEKIGAEYIDFKNKRRIF